MSNINNWKFANLLEQFKAREIDTFAFELKKAEEIINDKNYQWKDETQKKIGQAKFSRMNDRLAFLNHVFENGKDLCIQHENLVNKLVKWYEKWRKDISNDGIQECEMMQSQADMLGDIFSEIYRELMPLKLDLKEPKALNLK